MVQWMNLHWNNIFVNQMRLSMLQYLMKAQCYYSVNNAFQLVNYIVRRVIMEAYKSGTPCFFMSIAIIKYYHT